jgi:hypothetical protein
MEKIALTCSVLYKQDLLDKKKEIEELKKIFIDDIIQSPVIKTEQDYKEFKDNLWNDIDILLNIIIVKNFPTSNVPVSLYIF